MTILARIGLTPEQVQRALTGKVKSPIHREKAEHERRTYTKAQLHSIIELKQAGYTTLAINQRTGIPEGTICHHWSKWMKLARTNDPENLPAQ